MNESCGGPTGAAGRAEMFRSAGGDVDPDFRDEIAIPSRTARESAQRRQSATGISEKRKSSRRVKQTKKSREMLTRSSLNASKIVAARREQYERVVEVREVLIPTRRDSKASVMR